MDPKNIKKEPKSIKIEARLAPGGGGGPREPLWSPKLSRAENRIKNKCPRLPQTPPQNDHKIAKSYFFCFFLCAFRSLFFGGLETSFFMIFESKIEGKLVRRGVFLESCFHVYF